MLKRVLNLPLPPKRTFFLWGPRASGKTSLLEQTFADAFVIDLLKSEDFRELKTHPERLREIAEPHDFVIIDEIQKIPELLDEVHRLIQKKNKVFALCGSSARKVKRGHANLLGGRALRYELYGLVYPELKNQFEITRAVNHGPLPDHYLSDAPKLLIESYVSDYLKEEVAAEGLVRNLAHFSNFLDSAALSDAEIVNYSTCARETGVSSQTIKGYFDILTDTLIGSWLPSFKKWPKRKTILAPKFYFADVGVVNFLAKRGYLEPGSELYGKGFENWIYHELRSWNEYGKRFKDIYYWRLKSGIEVDFVIGDMESAIECKATSRVRSDHLKGLRELVKDHPKVKEHRTVVCLETRERVTEDGIRILPVDVFLKKLWKRE